MSAFKQEEILKCQHLTRLIYSLEQNLGFPSGLDGSLDVFPRQLRAKFKGRI